MLYNNYEVRQIEYEIEWLRKQIELSSSEKQKIEYLHQIRKKELEIAFNSNH